MTTDATPNPSQVNLDEIGQIAVTVTDLARSRDFYQNILGMHFLFDAGSMVFFQCGKIRFAIGNSGTPVAPSGTILYFRVPDIHAAHKALVDKGVVFTRGTVSRGADGRSRSVACSIPRSGWQPD